MAELPSGPLFMQEGSHCGRPAYSFYAAKLLFGVAATDITQPSSVCPYVGLEGPCSNSFGIGPNGRAYTLGPDGQIPGDCPQHIDEINIFSKELLRDAVLARLRQRPGEA